MGEQVSARRVPKRKPDLHGSARYRAEEPTFRPDTVGGMSDRRGVGRGLVQRTVGRTAIVVAMALVATGCLVPDPASIRGTLGYRYDAREPVDASITWGPRNLDGDVYLPSGTPKGTIIYYSGGGFTRWVTYGTDAALAHVRRGWAVFVPDYRLNTRFPAAVVDAVDAVRYVRTRGAARDHAHLVTEIISE